MIVKIEDALKELKLLNILIDEESYNKINERYARHTSLSSLISSNMTWIDKGENYRKVSIFGRPFEVGDYFIYTMLSVENDYENSIKVEMVCISDKEMSEFNENYKYNDILDKYVERI